MDKDRWTGVSSVFAISCTSNAITEHPTGHPLDTHWTSKKCET